VDWVEIARLARRHAAEMGAAGRRVLEEAVEAHRFAEEAVTAQRMGKELRARELGGAAERAWAMLQTRLHPPATERYTEIERALAHSSTEGIIAEEASRQAAARELLAATAVKRGAIQSPTTGKAAWYRRFFK